MCLTSPTRSYLAISRLSRALGKPNTFVNFRCRYFLLSHQPSDWWPPRCFLLHSLMAIMFISCASIFLISSFLTRDIAGSPFPNSKASPTQVADFHPPDDRPSRTRSFIRPPLPIQTSVEVSLFPCPISGALDVGSLNKTKVHNDSQTLNGTQTPSRPLGSCSNRPASATQIAIDVGTYNRGIEVPQSISSLS